MQFCRSSEEQHKPANIEPPFEIRSPAQQSGISKAEAAVNHCISPSDRATLGKEDNLISNVLYNINKAE